MSDPNNEKNYTQFTKKVTVGCYIALAVAVLFFSGLPLLGKAASALAQVSSLPWA